MAKGIYKSKSISQLDREFKKKKRPILVKKGKLAGILKRGR